MQQAQVTNRHTMPPRLNHAPAAAVAHAHGPGLGLSLSRGAAPLSLGASPSLLYRAISETDAGFYPGISPAEGDAYARMQALTLMQAAADEGGEGRAGVSSSPSATSSPLHRTRALVRSLNGRASPQARSQHTHFALSPLPGDASASPRTSARDLRRIHSPAPAAGPAAFHASGMHASKTPLLPAAASLRDTAPDAYPCDDAQAAWAAVAAPTSAESYTEVLDVPAWKLLDRGASPDSPLPLSRALPGLSGMRASSLKERVEETSPPLLQRTLTAPEWPQLHQDEETFLLLQQQRKQAHLARQGSPEPEPQVEANGNASVASLPATVVLPPAFPSPSPLRGLPPFLSGSPAARRRSLLSPLTHVDSPHLAVRRLTPMVASASSRQTHMRMADSSTFVQQAAPAHTATAASPAAHTAAISTLRAASAVISSDACAFTPIRSSSLQFASTRRHDLVPPSDEPPPASPAPIAQPLSVAAAAAPAVLTEAPAAFSFPAPALASPAASCEGAFVPTLPAYLLSSRAVSSATSTDATEVDPPTPQQNRAASDTLLEEPLAPLPVEMRQAAVAPSDVDVANDSFADVALPPAQSVLLSPRAALSASPPFQAGHLALAPELSSAESFLTRPLSSAMWPGVPLLSLSPALSAFLCTPLGHHRLLQQLRAGAVVKQHGIHLRNIMNHNFDEPAANRSRRTSELGEAAAAAAAAGAGPKQPQPATMTQLPSVLPCLTEEASDECEDATPAACVDQSSDDYSAPIGSDAASSVSLRFIWLRGSGSSTELCWARLRDRASDGSPVPLGSFPVSWLSGVCTGSHSPTFSFCRVHSSRSNGATLAPDASRCMSLLLHSGDALDLECSSEAECGTWMRAFAFLHRHALKQEHDAAAKSHSDAEREGEGGTASEQEFVQAREASFVASTDFVLPSAPPLLPCSSAAVTPAVAAAPRHRVSASAASGFDLVLPASASLGSRTCTSANVVTAARLHSSTRRQQSSSTAGMEAQQLHGTVAAAAAPTVHAAPSPARASAAPFSESEFAQWCTAVVEQMTPSSTPSLLDGDALLMAQLVDPAALSMPLALVDGTHAHAHRDACLSIVQRLTLAQRQLFMYKRDHGRLAARLEGQLAEKRRQIAALTQQRDQYRALTAAAESLHAEWQRRAPAQQTQVHAHPTSVAPPMHVAAMRSASDLCPRVALPGFRASEQAMPPTSSAASLAAAVSSPSSSPFSHWDPPHQLRVPSASDKHSGADADAAVPSLCSPAASTVASSDLSHSHADPEHSARSSSAAHSPPSLTASLPPHLLSSSSSSSSSGGSYRSLSRRSDDSSSAHHAQRAHAGSRDFHTYASPAHTPSPLGAEANGRELHAKTESRINDTGSQDRCVTPPYSSDAVLLPPACSRL